MICASELSFGFQKVLLSTVAIGIIIIITEKKTGQKFQEMWMVGGGGGVITAHKQPK